MSGQPSPLPAAPRVRHRQLKVDERAGAALSAVWYEHMARLGGKAARPQRPSHSALSAPPKRPAAVLLPLQDATTSPFGHDAATPAKAAGSPFREIRTGLASADLLAHSAPPPPPLVRRAPSPVRDKENVGQAPAAAGFSQSYMDVRQRLAEMDARLQRHVQALRSWQTPSAEQAINKRLEAALKAKERHYHEQFEALKSPTRRATAAVAPQRPAAELPRLALVETADIGVEDLERSEEIIKDNIARLTEQLRVQDALLASRRKERVAPVASSSRIVGGDAQKAPLPVQTEHDRSRERSVAEVTRPPIQPTITSGPASTGRSSVAELIMAASQSASSSSSSRAASVVQSAIDFTGSRAASTVETADGALQIEDGTGRDAASGRASIVAEERLAETREESKSVGASDRSVRTESVAEVEGAFDKMDDADVQAIPPADQQEKPSSGLHTGFAEIEDASVRSSGSVAEVQSAIAASVAEDEPGSIIGGSVAEELPQTEATDDDGTDGRALAAVDERSIAEDAVATDGDRSRAPSSVPESLHREAAGSASAASVRESPASAALQSTGRQSVQSIQEDQDGFAEDFEQAEREEESAVTEKGSHEAAAVAYGAAAEDSEASVAGSLSEEHETFAQPSFSGDSVSSIKESIPETIADENSERDDGKEEEKEEAAHTISKVAEVEHVAFIPNVEHVRSNPEVDHVASIPEVEHVGSIPEVEHVGYIPEVDQVASIPDVEQVASIPDVEQVASIPSLPSLESLKSHDSFAREERAADVSEPGHTRDAGHLTLSRDISHDSLVQPANDVMPPQMRPDVAEEARLFASPTPPPPMPALVDIHAISPPRDLVAFDFGEFGDGGPSPSPPRWRNDSHDSLVDDEQSVPDPQLVESVLRKEIALKREERSHDSLVALAGGPADMVEDLEKDIALHFYKLTSGDAEADAALVAFYKNLDAAALEQSRELEGAPAVPPPPVPEPPSHVESDRQAATGSPPSGAKTADDSPQDRYVEQDDDGGDMDFADYGDERHAGSGGGEDEVHGSASVSFEHGNDNERAHVWKDSFSLGGEREGSETAAGSRDAVDESAINESDLRALQRFLEDRGPRMSVEPEPILDMLGRPILTPLDMADEMTRQKKAAPHRQLTEIMAELQARKDASAQEAEEASRERAEFVRRETLRGVPAEVKRVWDEFGEADNDGDDDDDATASPPVTLEAAQIERQLELLVPASSAGVRSKMITHAPQIASPTTPAETLLNELAASLLPLSATEATHFPSRTFGWRSEGLPARFLRGDLVRRAAEVLDAHARSGSAEANAPVATALAVDGLVRAFVQPFSDLYVLPRPQDIERLLGQQQVQPRAAPSAGLNRASSVESTTEVVVDGGSAAIPDFTEPLHYY